MRDNEPKNYDLILEHVRIFLRSVCPVAAKAGKNDSCCQENGFLAPVGEVVGGCGGHRCCRVPQEAKPKYH